MTSHHQRTTAHPAHLSPEANQVGIFMCEQTAGLLDAITRGVEQTDKEHARGGQQAAAAAPAQPTTEGAGGVPVQLLEPDLPPTDDTNDARDRALADWPAQAPRSGRPPARTATTPQTPADQTTTAPRHR